jgi:hypothetical protein
MSKQFADDLDRCALAQEFGRKRVSEGVGGELNTGPDTQPFD